MDMIPSIAKPLEPILLQQTSKHKLSAMSPHSSLSFLHKITHPHHQQHHHHHDHPTTAAAASMSWEEQGGGGVGGDIAKPLPLIADAFEKLAKFLTTETSDEEDLHLVPFTDACSLVSVLFNCLGIAFKFAEMEYCAKVRGLVEASKTYNTLPNILDHDVKNNTVRTPGSLSRNLRRVRQGLDLIRALFEQFLSADEYSLREAASTAYAEVCAPYHTWAVRTAVFAGMYALPSRQQLLLRLNETDQSVEKEMRRYIAASHPVIEYIDKLYIARNISLDW